MKNRLLFTLAMGFYLGAITLQAEDKHDHNHDHGNHDHHAHKAVCPVSGEELDADAVAVELDGKTYKFCCNKCAGKFKAHPGKYIKQEKTETYPLKTCVVSGKDLGSMGEPYVHEHEGHTVQLCCKHCLKKFNADPEKYLKILSDAKK
jgi:YHS domain-containing protein